MNILVAMRLAQRTAMTMGLEMDQVSALEARKDFSTGGWTVEWQAIKSHYVVRVDREGSTCDVYTRSSKRKEKK